MQNLDRGRTPLRLALPLEVEGHAAKSVKAVDDDGDDGDDDVEAHTGKKNL